VNAKRPRPPATSVTGMIASHRDRVRFTALLIADDHEVRDQGWNAHGGSGACERFTNRQEQRGWRARGRPVTQNRSSGETRDGLDRILPARDETARITDTRFRRVVKETMSPNAHRTPARPTRSRVLRLAHSSVAAQDRHEDQHAAHRRSAGFRQMALWPSLRTCWRFGRATARHHLRTDDQRKPSGCASRESRGNVRSRKRH